MTVPEPGGRLAELERRVRFDPSPFVFAQLAEEYRHANRLDDAINCCRAGLARHPGYLSARLILGRALAATARWDEAVVEYEQVVAAAPDNLAAMRELAEICHRLGRSDEALKYYRRALALARNDRDLERVIATLSSEPPGADTTRVDFDALLASLGRPDQQPPPVIELLLTDPTALLPAPDAVAPALGDAPDDRFAALERDLREHVGGATPSTAQPELPTIEVAPSTADAAAARIEASIVADLEAWLDALARDRAPKRHS